MQLRLIGDTELIELARAGDRRAVEQLIERYQDSIYSIAMTFTRDPHRAEDLAQEAWIRILKGLAGFRGEARFTTWMYRVVMNTFLSSSRPAEVPLSREAPAADESEVSRLETSLAVQQAVAELPEEYRAVVALRFIADLPYQEIAAALNVPLGTVQSRLNRALTRLSASLGPVLRGDP
ncbi:MAG: sigma-70 family RNA polymerase sigma factor [Candidatus Eremiobacterota bacterium]